MVVKKLQRGDLVRVLRGKSRGMQSAVLAVLPREGKVLVEGANLVKKHVKARRSGSVGQRVTVASPLPIANVQVVCRECKRGTRVLIRRTPDGRERVCKKCQSVLANATK